MAAHAARVTRRGRRLAAPRSARARPTGPGRSPPGARRRTLRGGRRAGRATPTRARACCVNVPSDSSNSSARPTTVVTFGGGSSKSSGGYRLAVARVMPGGSAKAAHGCRPTSASTTRDRATRPGTRPARAARTPPSGRRAARPRQQRWSTQGAADRRASSCARPRPTAASPGRTASARAAGESATAVRRLVTQELTRDRDRLPLRSDP